MKVYIVVAMIIYENIQVVYKVYKDYNQALKVKEQLECNEYYYDIDILESDLI